MYLGGRKGASYVGGSGAHGSLMHRMRSTHSSPIGPAAAILTGTVLISTVVVLIDKVCTVRIVDCILADK